MIKSIKKYTYESKFDRKYACFMNNHQGLSKVKKANRREFRTKLKRELEKEKGDVE
jgi:hypothetical protein